MKTEFENNSKITELLKVPEVIKLTDVDAHINGLPENNVEARERALLDLDTLFGKLQNHIQLLSLYLKQRHLLGNTVTTAPVDTDSNYTKQEVAARYRVSIRTITNWISSGLQTTLIGGVIRISESALQEFIKNNKRRKYNWKSISRT